VGRGDDLRVASSRRRPAASLGSGWRSRSKATGELYAIEAPGTGGFFYGESRVVFPRGYYLSAHLRGLYSGAGEAAAILHKVQACMQSALQR